MDVNTAICLMEDLVLKPGWSVAVRDNSNRFECTIIVEFTYPCFNTNKSEAPTYATEMTSGAAFPIMVRDMEALDLYRAVIGHALAIEQHEWREALRVRSTLWSPFHPHRKDGMERWGDVQGDLMFGVA